MDVVKCPLAIEVDKVNEVGILLDNLPSLGTAPSSPPTVLDAHTSQCTPYPPRPRFRARASIIYSCPVYPTRLLGSLNCAVPHNPRASGEPKIF
jgi:hypothetical protein